MEAIRKYKIHCKPQQKIDEEAVILDNFTPERKPGARRLLRQVKPYMHWNSEGELFDGQRVVPNSNISELLSVTLDKTAPLQPFGWKEYASGLKAARLPRDLINNDSLWKYMNPKSSKTVKSRGWEEY